MEKDREFMAMALEEAERAAGEGEVPVGAVLVDGDGQVLARAGNRTIGDNDPTGHAEILVLREGAQRTGNYRLPGTTLYATVEPCPMCAGALVWARVGRLVYGAPDPKGGAAGTLYSIPEDERLNHRVEITRGVMEDECRGVLQRFFRDRRGEGGNPEVPTE